MRQKKDKCYLKLTKFLSITGLLLEKNLKMGDINVLEISGVDIFCSASGSTGFSSISDSFFGEEFNSSGGMCIVTVVSVGPVHESYINNNKFSQFTIDLITLQE